MGTFIPLLLSMAAQNGLNFASSLFFAGLFNMATGAIFAIPMAVQPMKAIAAVAITEGLTVPQILAAGMIVGAVVLFLGAAGLINWINRIIPRCVVRGIQLGLGLSLMVKGVQMVMHTNAMVAPDSYLTGAIAAMFAVVFLFSSRIPTALVLFAAGIILAIWHDPGVVGSLHVGISLPQWTPITWNDLSASFVKAALPQLPLTILNSVVAICALSSDLFPDRPATPRKVAISVGLMNLIAAPFGGMPMCHGAGGLAGQYRFGARTNGSILFLGGAKLLLAVFLGSSLMAICVAFPRSVLGVMLAIASLELAQVAFDQTKRVDVLVMLITAGVCLGLNIAMGFLIGLAIYLLLGVSGTGSCEKQK